MCTEYGESEVIPTHTVEQTTTMEGVEQNVNTNNLPMINMALRFGVFGASRMKTYREQQLWEDHYDITITIKDVGVIINNFNSILVAHERDGRVLTYSTKGMFSRFPFYLGNNWKQGDLKEHLDRMSINLRWHLKFQEACVYHLSLFKSDHTLPWIKFCNNTTINKQRRSFRFL
ncbi:hypothetical protein CR513_44966, partial [Mucuna pruriens]